MSESASSYRRSPTELPWPTGWARRTRGPQYRPAIALGAACVLAGVLLAMYNPADAFLLLVFAAGLFVWALRPAVDHPISVTLGEAGARRRGVRFPLRISTPLGLLRRPSITLTPDVVMTDGPVAIPWSQITEIRATSAETGAPHPLLPPPTLNWITIGVADAGAVAGTRAAARAGAVTGAGAVARAARTLAAQFGGNTVAGFATTRLLSDPVVLYHALHYYLDNPHARPELATEHAVRRIGEARVQPWDV